MAMQNMTVPAGEPAVAAAPDRVPITAGGEVLCGGVVIAQRPSGDYGREVEGAVLGEHEDDDDGLSSEDFSDDDLSSVDFSDEDGTDDEYVDSDSEFEDDDGQPPDAGEHAAAAAAKVIFLGRPTRCASVQNTIGFMRLAAEDAAPGKVTGGEIIVHYQYTRFTRSQRDGDDAAAVDTHVLGPKVCSVRFHVAPHAAASDPASSLRLAGASLAHLIYPARFREELRELWFGLVAAAPVRVPPRAATRLVVTVDVGILRPGDCTAERMMSVCAAMEAVACEREKRPADVDVGMELHLPAPLVLELEDEVRPAKRRRVIGEDCCPICWEALERGVAAWPRCSHVFHGRCLEEHLVRGREECPMCRTGLKVNASS